jgi:hypothetical protein
MILTGEFYTNGDGYFVDRDCYWQYRLLKHINEDRSKSAGLNE